MVTYLSGQRIQGTSTLAGGKVGTGSGNFTTANLHYTGNGDQDGDMTAAFWFYRIQASPNYLTCYNQVAAGGSSTHRLQIGTQAAGTWEIYGDTKKLDGGTPPLNTWIHIAVTTNGTTWKLYENGIETDSGTGSSSRDNDGLVSWMGEGTGAWAQGYMDEACLYDRALSAAEVLSLADGSKKPNDATLDTSNSLTLYLPMDTTASSGLTNWYDDKSSTGQAIALTGSPTLITTSGSTDEKVAITDVPVGTRYEETDTRKIYRSIATASLTDLTWVSEKAIQYSGSDHRQPTSLWFKPDGEEFYVVDEEDNNLTQWSMSTANAWDITNASHTNTLSINSQETTATGLAFSPDGTKMYICGVSGQDTNQYTLSTAWDISGTVTHNGVYSDSSRDNAPYDITMGDSGTKFYILGMQHEKIYQYSLSTANVITSGVTYVTEYDGSSEWSNVTDATFTSDGKKMFVIDQVHDKIFEYALTTAWNVSTASLTGNSSYSSKENQPHGIQIGNSDTNLFLLGWENDKVHRYTCGATEWVEKGTA